MAIICTEMVFYSIATLIPDLELNELCIETFMVTRMKCKRSVVSFIIFARWCYKNEWK